MIKDTKNKQASNLIRSNLTQRLKYLRKGEFACIFLLPTVLFLNLVGRNVLDWKPYAYSMFIICIILMEGSLYWYLKIKSLESKTAKFPIWFVGVYQFFHWLNIVLLSLYLTFWIYGISEASSFYFQPSIWANLLFLFAILEHINYFYYQLSHDNKQDIDYLLKHKKLRKSPLSTDLVRTKKKNKVI